MALVLFERQGSVAVVTLNRPQRHNSLVPELLQEFLDALIRAENDTAVRALVLRANGRSFSTGGDAQGFVANADHIEAYAQQIVGLLNDVILAMIDLRMPIIAAVHGLVTGGSLGFVLGSDIVLVAPEARFAPYYSEVGPSPDGGWAVLLPLIIGQKRAAEILYLNGTIDAETAVAWGLANRLVPADRLHTQAMEMAQQIALKKRGSIRHTKMLLNLDRGELALRLHEEHDHFVRQMVTAEAMDGFREFLQQLQSRAQEDEDAA